MARISKFERIDRERNAHRHTETRAQFGVFSEGGQRYLQIETVGSATRRERDVVSQSILLDEAGMRALAEIIRTALSGK